MAELAAPKRVGRPKKAAKTGVLRKPSAASAADEEVLRKPAAASDAEEVLRKPAAAALAAAPPEEHMCPKTVMAKMFLDMLPEECVPSAYRGEGRTSYTIPKDEGNTSKSSISVLLRAGGAFYVTHAMGEIKFPSGKRVTEVSMNKQGGLQLRWGHSVEATSMVAQITAGWIDADEAAELALATANAMDAD